MKKIIIYFLAVALTCVLAVSLGYAQAPPALENAPPFVQPLPPPPSIPDLMGCWSCTLWVNPGTTNVAVPVINALYLEITAQDGTRCSGTLHVFKGGQWSHYAVDGFINGSACSAFSNVGTEHRYVTGTLTEESGEMVMYGIGIVTGLYFGTRPPDVPAGIPMFLNQIVFFKGTRPAGITCP